MASSTRPRIRSRHWVVAALVAVNVAACSALEFGAGDPGGGSGGAGASSGTAGNGGVIDYDGGGGSGATTGEYAHLCGPGACDVSASQAVSSCIGRGGNGGGGGGGAPGGGAGGAGGGISGGGGAGGGSSGAGGAGGENGGAGAGGSGGDAGAGGGIGGAGGTGGGAGGTGGSGVGGAGGVGGSGVGGSGVGGSGVGGSGAGGTGGGREGPTLVECKVVVGSEGDAPERACIESSETYTELLPCNTAADCGPGLGCVLAAADQSTGVCRPYCCGDVEACALNTYCAPRPMTEGAAASLAIPVCVDADKCTLLEEGQCAAGLACAVVRADGTTACIQPGPGRQGDACPCAAGYQCTKLVNQCRKICHTDAQSSPQECDPGFKCQGNASLPHGFGLCISTAAL